MRQRFLNRLAQRYLVRGNAALSIVGPPGADLANSADWYVEEAAVTGTFHLYAAPDRRRSLVIRDGNLLFAGGTRAEPDLGTWAFHPVAGRNRLPVPGER